MSKSILKVLDIIKDLSLEEEMVVREYRPRELRVVWTAPSTQAEYYLGLNLVKRLLMDDMQDPRLEIVLKFIANQLSAPEAQLQIQRLEKLKAFW